ncbi:Lineage-specific thermal regulator protein, partial [Dysosmobacter welbionis]
MLQQGLPALGPPQATGPVRHIISIPQGKSHLHPPSALAGRIGLPVHRQAALDAHFALQLDLAAAAQVHAVSAGGEEIDLPRSHAFRDQSLLLSCHALLLPARATFDNQYRSAALRH